MTTRLGSTRSAAGCKSHADQSGISALSRSPSTFCQVLPWSRDTTTGSCLKVQTIELPSAVTATMPPVLAPGGTEANPCQVLPPSVEIKPLGSSFFAKPQTVPVRTTRLGSSAAKSSPDVSWQGGL